MSKIVAKLVRAYFYNSIKKSGMVRYEGGELEPMRWYKMYLDGCIAATDLTCPMYIKKGRSKNLVVFFYGGGLVYSEETANGFITGDSLLMGVTMLATGEPDPVNEQLTFVSRTDNGLFSLGEDNRFADWNIAAINYGTGDFHVGAAEVSYKGLFKEDFAGSAKFHKDLTKQIRRLKTIRPDFGIYIHNFPAKNKADCHEHCTLTMPTFKAGRVYGISPMDWLYDCVNGNIRDVGLHLLEETK